MDAASGLTRQLCPAQLLVQGDDALHLLPGARQEVLLLILDDERPQTSRDAKARIGIQFLEPGWFCGGIKRGPFCVPAAIEGRGDRQLVATVDQQILRRIEERSECGDPGIALGSWPGGRDRIRRFERAFKPESTWRGSRQPEARISHVHIADTNGFRQRARRQEANQELEIAGGAGVKCPLEVDRQPDAHARRSPRRA